MYMTVDPRPGLALRAVGSPARAVSAVRGVRMTFSYLKTALNFLIKRTEEVERATQLSLSRWGGTRDGEMRGDPRGAVESSTP